MTAPADRAVNPQHRGTSIRLVQGSSQARIYGEIWHHGPVSRADLVELTGMRKSTIFVTTEELVATGLVAESGRRNSGVQGGRRPLLLRANPDAHRIAGVHVGTNFTTVAVSDALGEVLDSRVFSTIRRDPEAALRAVGETLTELVEAAGGPASLAAVGVVVPGLVDRGSGLCVLAPNLGWRDVPVGTKLAERLADTGLTAPVYVHNTVQAMAAAEVAQLQESQPTMAMLYVGTGVGAAVITDGMLLSGSTGLAGEIGHLVIPGATHPCSCGQRGCLETLVSGPAIIRRARSEGLRRPDRRALTPADVGNLARQGNPAAREMVAQVGKELGLAARILVQLTNPDTLVMAGSVTGLGDLLLDPVRREITDHTLPQLNRDLVIRRSLLDDAGKLRGAIALALHGACVPIRGLDRTSA